MTAPAEIRTLVEKFEQHGKDYRLGKYNETQLRRDFLDPFFAALGWDIFNQKNYSERYREVFHEVSVEVEGGAKAADYAFRVGEKTVFFVEAKKPSVNIETNPEPAFQLRRYAWSAKLPISLLTDFEQLAVYDCRTRPVIADRPSVGRVRLYHYSEYIEKWDEIAAVFSHEAVLGGAFDQFAEGTKGRKGTAKVDDAFLEEIERWRDLLAHNIALRNPPPLIRNERDLNFAVQMTIDRIIFLRICEDRGIEPDEQLRDISKRPDVYPELLALFRRADTKYNSGLFHFAEDTLTPGLSIDDKVLKDILHNLYYPESPYVFTYISADILGQVYEQFLGKVIRLTAGHQAKVEEKPEVRKAGGVYYTPKYIVDYIVKNTVGKLLDPNPDLTPNPSPERRGEMTPKEAAKLRILDPACGSGSFLLGAYQYLLDWHLTWYSEHEAEKWARGNNPVIYQTYSPSRPADSPPLSLPSAGLSPHFGVQKWGDERGAGAEWRLTTAEKKRILLDNLFGVDIDPQAVEVTKLSLLLKVLEGASGQLSLGMERVLPDLSSNIKCGNSLIGPDYYEGRQLGLGLYDEEEQYRVNAFNWQRAFPHVFSMGGFDAVIGNPPYDVMEKERGKSSWPHTALTDYVRLKEEYKFALGGKLNLFRFFVVRSLTLLRSTGRYGMIVPLSLLADISCAKTRRYVMSNSENIIADCFPQKDNPNRRIFFDAKLSTCVITCEKKPTILEKAQITVRVYPWNKFEDEYRNAVIRFSDISLIDPENVPIPFVDSQQWDICKKIYSLKEVTRLGEIRDFAVTRGEINQTIYRDFISENSNNARLLKGVEVGQYCLNEKLSQGHREWFDETEYLRTNKPKPVIQQKRIATQRITGVDEKLRIVAMIIDPPAYFADSTNSIALENPSQYRLEYLLGILNSWMFQWRFKLTSSNNNVATNELDAMPFRTINFAVPAEKAAHDKLVGLVEQMLELHRRLPSARTPREKEILQRQVESTDGEIDRLVYGLYGLTEEEIKIVEGALK